MSEQMVGAVIEGYRLSPQQRRLWLLMQDEAKSTYNSRCLVKVRGTLDRNLLQQAVNGVVDRHEILRTSYQRLSGMKIPLQVIKKSMRVRIFEADLSGLEEKRQNSSLEELYWMAGQTPFDLENDPLLRVFLVSLCSTEHTLLISLPAICADTTSLKIFVAELSRFYSEYLSGVKMVDREPLQYADLSEWQNELLEAVEMQPGRAYWVKRSIPDLTTPKLPCEEEKAVNIGLEIASASAGIEHELVLALGHFAKNNQSQLFLPFLACWQILLCRIAGQQKITVGAAYDGRRSSELEEAMGLFVRFLPSSCDLTADASFDSLFKKLLEESAANSRWQEYFSWNYAENATDENTPPDYFPFCFEYQEFPGEYNESDIAFDIHRQHSCAERFKIKLKVSNRHGELRVEMEYDQGLYGPDDVRRLLDQYRTLLREAVERPQAPARLLGLLSESERRRLVIDYNRTEKRYEQAGPTHQMFERQVELTPERVAVEGSGEHLSYAELNRRANGLARRLRRSGVGIEKVVGISLRRRVELVVAMLGVLKAGGAYAPVELSYPAERKRYLLEDAGAQALLTEEGVGSEELEWGGEVIKADSFGRWLEDEGGENLDVKVSGENLCYVIYTSGSTGRPKGVMVTHGGLENYVRWSQEAYGMEGGGGSAVQSSVGFDLMVTSIYPPLVSGGKVEMLEEGRGLEELAERMKQGAGYGLIKVTPGQLEVMRELGGAVGERGSRVIVVGGEALRKEVVRDWKRDGVRVMNEYGPTETVVGCSVYEVEEECEEGGGVAIGRPIANTKLYVLDEELRPVGVGEEGEIYIGGAGLARGYKGKAEATGEVFVPDVLSGREGGRLYRSGDRGRIRGDGNLEYVGRRDKQVKVKGYRVELGEIEAVLVSHPAIQDAVVIAEEDSSGDKQILAYLVPDAEQAHTVRQLLHFQSQGTLNGHSLYELPNGLTIAHHKKNETEYLYKDIFLDKVYLRNGVTLNNAHCIFDVGANIGMFTLLAGRDCEDAVIYSFEPTPQIFELLKLNTSLYGLNAKLFNCALSDEPATAIFTYYPQISIMSGRFADQTDDRQIVKSFELNRRRLDGENGLPWDDEVIDDLLRERLMGEKFSCEMKTLSQVIRDNQVEKIDLLKIDVEKSEMNVLMGIEEADWEKISQIVIEVQDIEGRLADITSLLVRHGYGVSVEQDSSLHETSLYNIYAVRNSISDRDGVAASSEAKKRWSGVRAVTEDLDRLAKAKLPEYMTPAVYTLMESLPLTRNGKIDISALPKPVIGVRPEQSHGQEPQNVYQEMVAGIWREVLKIEQIGAEDNFFEVGGHSLQIAQVISRVREAFGVELALRFIFESPTLAQMASQIEVLTRQNQGLTIPPLEKALETKQAPLSFAQQQLWFLDQLEPGATAYNIPLAVRISGQLHVAAFEKALTELVRRHDILRTTFSVIQGRPVQVVDVAPPLKISTADLSLLPDGQQKGEVRRLSKMEFDLPFNLSTGLPLRIEIVRLSAREHVAFITLHHIVSDGWSMGVLIKEMASLYEAFSDDRPPNLPDLPIQYADYAIWQRNWLQGGALEAHLQYWKERLGREALPLRLPTDRPRPLKQSFNGASHRVAVPKRVSEALNNLSRRENVTLFMTLLAAFQTLLHYHTGQDDIVVGTDVANRNHLHTEKLIGFFINQLVLRTDLSGNPTFTELLGRVRRMALGAYAHQNLPFERLVEALKPERKLSQAPLFQVKLVLQNVPMSAPTFPGLSLRLLEPAGLAAKLDLTLILAEKNDGIIGHIEYNTDLFNQMTITRIASQFEWLLTEIIEKPELRVSEFKQSLAELDKRRQDEAKKKREALNLNKLKKVLPRAVHSDQRSLIRISYLKSSPTLPLIIEPEVEDVDLAAWARNNKHFIEAELLKHGAILFRGFDIDGVSAFEKFAQAICGQLLRENGEHPRENLSNNIYTPVFYPPDKRLLWHNENSFNNQWPGKIWFCCQTPARLGGETPLVDSRQVFKMIRPEIRERFMRNGVKYVRNYGSGLGLSWPTIFQSSDRKEVERICKQNLIEFEWSGEDNLTTHCVRPAAIRHPKSNEPAWFNQAQHWHVSCLDAETRKSMSALFCEAGFPRNCYYGDGSPIEDSVMEEIIQAYSSLEVRFPWKCGDVLMLDNILTAHGRNPFAGDRKLLVAMGEPISFAEVKMA